MFKYAMHLNFYRQVDHKKKLDVSMIWYFNMHFIKTTHTMIYHH